MDIVVRMRGGLGNQLFQYGYARSLQERYRAKSIILDTREYRRYKLRDFELGAFKLDGSVIITEDIADDLKYYLSRNIYFSINGTIMNLFNRNLDFLFPVLTRYGLFFTYRDIHGEHLNKKLDRIILYGFFQDMRAVENIKFRLNYELTRRNNSGGDYQELNRSIKATENSIALSVRIGKDYEEAGYGICPPEYYKRGIRELEGKLGDHRIYVFSDDIVRAKGMLDGMRNINFVENFDPIDQLLLMKECHHFVISNSSFAWWGSYLSRYGGKIVFVPEFWYPGKRTRNTHLIYPNVKILEL